LKLHFLTLTTFSTAESGRSFYFKVNDAPIFAMGVNVIPLDILPEKSYNPETVERLLSAVATYTEMNMLRVWGGGVYESDYFYELADKYGLMIWQDFVFASAMYPANDDFLRLVGRFFEFKQFEKC
jgi:beta-mannosidase